MFEYNESLEQALHRNVEDALREDIGRTDWTAQLVTTDRRIRARVIAKESAVIAGQPWFSACILRLDPTASIEGLVAEGGTVATGKELVRLEGDAQALLSAERSALNFLQMLSGVATATHRYVERIADVSPNPKGCAMLDTRKTMPGLRQAQKYAVRVGGGVNHRMALWDGILIKENHIAAAGGIKEALERARQLGTDVPVQIEVENLAELEEALAAGATSVLLDDFTLDDMHRAFALNAGRALLEVSGGVDWESLQAIASTGIDRISSGKLTKDVRAIDLSMRFDT
ncbi:carboxylating nicotinate-nucleotide diphosphorylase [Cupriavidus basilensis]|uniref:carboxylating nicotinate-nucleotide diphosphorylase n=1 Tax=Cupriavidus basilensis TaxID=68895 RepID=UPI00157B328E|nr:carboxylating nicotinate-nucleotide diphosphorylase [Cupriavidus basilensis]NUA27799.1 carboxylating nicotinate-nucleotide diphosphorylase [Cupriavidus basilensis]